MSKSIQLKNINNEKMYPHPYYPVGSIYLSINDTNPATWFGGTWEQIAKGRTLIGVDTNDTDFNTVEKTGGNKTHKHLLPFGINNNVGNWEQLHWNCNFGYGYKAFTSPNYNNINNTPIGSSKTMHQPYSETVNNIPPYFTCYIWCRTA